MRKFQLVGQCSIELILLQCGRIYKDAEIYVLILSE